MSTTPASRFCLRDLPLPAKVVVTCFLLAVGLGYTAALVQLHFQDSKSGQPMPTVEDVVLKFTGMKKAVGPPQPPTSDFVRLITAPEEGLVFAGSGTMTPAFFNKCPDFTKTVRGGEHLRAQLRAERTGERDALVLWANADPTERHKAYQNDHFGVEAKDMPTAITPKYRNGDAIRIKSIIDARCARCHRTGGEDGDAERYPLDTYAAVEKYLSVKEAKVVGGWVKVQEPMSLTKLTQSTHAHLLSFAVLFSLTGLTFAFTSYPASVRCIVGPLALVAIVTDVCFWWLARLSENYGVYFAMGVIGTGGLVGVGLGAQILLSLWNMYGPRGKAVLLLLFLLGGAAAGLVFKQIVIPGLEEVKRQKEQPTANGGSDTKPPPVTPVAKLTRLEEVLQIAKGPNGKELPVLDMPFKAKPDKNMVRAFFDQDGADFAAAKKKKDQDTLDALMPERHAERLAVLAWMKLPDAERKKTFNADAFDLPAEAKQATPEYVKDGKFKIQTLIGDRCVRCHGGDPDAPFEDYETLKKYLEPKK